ncbi:MAG TPA: hypothetical protein PKO23_11200, partial [Candidatus Hydrogenedentes bacterium]|nr:hypothetical protein [Candidatus Hydrogenedentota bacterium]
MNPTSMARIYSGKRDAVMMVLLFLLSLCSPLLTPVQADILDVYESDGILLDLIVLEGDTIEIDTGSTPPKFSVDASPMGYTYKGRVVDGA